MMTLKPHRTLTYSCLATIRRHLSGISTWVKLDTNCLTTRMRSVSMCTCTSKQFHHTTTHPQKGKATDSDIWNISGFYQDEFQRKISKLEEPESEAKFSHVPVMVQEVVKLLHPKQGKLFIDMTFGAGGHTKAILEENPEAQVVCLDRDPLAYINAEELAKSYGPQQLLPCIGQFSELPGILKKHGISPGSVDGILFDVGASSMQYDQRERGFSLSREGPLDMRMDNGRNPDGVSAADVVNHLTGQELKHIIKKYGEDPLANKISHAIVSARNVSGRISTTKELADIIENALDGTIQRDKLSRKSHVATRTFQALRIFVNDELNEINNGLHVAYHYLRPHGVCVGISFQSLEDRIFKRHFHGIDMEEPKNMTSKQQARAMKDDHQKYSKELIQKLLKKRWIPVCKTAMTPTNSEVNENPRSRSAKLRAAIKGLDS